MIDFIKVICCCVLLFNPLVGSAIDLSPFDLVPPAPDTNHVSVALQQTHADSFFLNGVKSQSSPVIDTTQTQFRYARSYEVGGYDAVSYIQIPVGTIRPGGSLSDLPDSSGVGDTTLATAFWPYANEASRTYLGIAGYVILPTGTYSNQQVLNLGGHRYVTDLQVAYQTSVSQNLDAMVALDTMWFSPNNQFGVMDRQLSQKPLYTVQFGPTYKINDMFSVAATYFFVTGGESSVNGVENNNRIQTQRYLLSAQLRLPQATFMLQFGTDLDTQNGYAEGRRVALKVSKSF